jgi:hypothetical protein
MVPDSSTTAPKMCESWPGSTLLILGLQAGDLISDPEDHRVKKLSYGSSIICTLDQSDMKDTEKSLTVTQTLFSRRETVLYFMQYSILKKPITRIPSVHCLYVLVQTVLLQLASGGSWSVFTFGGPRSIFPCTLQMELCRLSQKGPIAQNIRRLICQNDTIW